MERAMRITFSGLRLTRGAPKRTARHTWELIGRTCAPQVLLIETYGGYPKGYLKCFASEKDAHSYIRARLAKKGYISPGEQPDGCLIVDYGQTIEGESFFLTDKRFINKVNIKAPEEDAWDSHRLIWKDFKEGYLSKSARKTIDFELGSEDLAHLVLDRIGFTVTDDAGKMVEAVREFNAFIQPEGMGGSLFEPLHSCMMAWADVPEVRTHIEKGSIAEMKAKRMIEKAEAAKEKPVIPEQVYNRWGAWS